MVIEKVYPSTEERLMRVERLVAALCIRLIHPGSFNEDLKRDFIELVKLVNDQSV